MTTRRANASNKKALDSFLATKARIDQMLARIQALSDDHFGADPERLNWADVGSLEYHTRLLRQISDFAFGEGEHAA